MVTLPLSESSESFVVAGARAGLGISLYSSSSGSRSRRRGRSPRGRSPRGGSGCCMTKSQPKKQLLGGGTTQRLPASTRVPLACAKYESAFSREAPCGWCPGSRLLCRLCGRSSSQHSTAFDCLSVHFHLGKAPRVFQSGILDVDADCSTTSFSAAQGGSFRLTSARPRHEPTQGNFSVADFRSSM